MAKRFGSRKNNAVLRVTEAPGKSTIKNLAMNQAPRNDIQHELPKPAEDVKMSSPVSLIGRDSIFESLLDVPIDLIDFKKTNRSTRSIERLSRSIEATDIINPIVVRKKDARYRVVCGSRRVEACRKSGRDKIPSRILRDDVPPEKDFELPLRENSDRKNFNAIEMADAIHDCIKALRPELELQGMLNLFINSDRRVKLSGADAATVTALKDITGRSSSTIRNWLTLLQLPHEVVNYIIDGELSPSKGYLFASHLDDLNHTEFHALVRKTIDEKLINTDLKQLLEPQSQSGANVSLFLNKLNSLEKKVRDNLSQFSPEESARLKKKVYQIYNLFTQQMTPSEQ